MEHIIYFTVLYSTHISWWYSTGFVDFQVVFVGDAVVLDTTEWASAGGGWQRSYSASECCHHWDQNRPPAQEPLKSSNMGYNLRNKHKYTNTHNDTSSVFSLLLFPFGWDGWLNVRLKALFSFLFLWSKVIYNLFLSLNSLYSSS